MDCTILSKIGSIIRRYRSLSGNKLYGVVLGRDELEKLDEEMHLYYFKHSLLELIAKNKNPTDLIEIFGVQIIPVLAKSAFYVIPKNLTDIFFDYYLKIEECK